MSQRGRSDASETVDSEGTDRITWLLLSTSQERHLVLSVSPSSCAEEETHRCRLTGTPLTDAADGSVPMSQSTRHLSAFPRQKDAQRWGLFTCSVALAIIWRPPPPSTFCSAVCLSRKCFYWIRTSLAAMGKVSALTEIGRVQKARHSCPDLLYDCMGHYIQPCSRDAPQGRR